MCFFWALWLYDGLSYEKGYWMVYLTLWTILSTCLYFTCTFVSAIWYKLESDHESVSLVKTFFAYFTWILFSIQVSLPLAITIVFWGALYDPGFDTQDTVMGALEHGVTEILILIEILFCLRVKLVLLHMVIPAIFGIVYVAANIGITFAGFTDPKTGQNYIYSLTDWKGDPVTAVITTVALLFGGIPVTYSIHYGISQLKQKCIPDCVAIESNASTTVNVGMVVMSDKKTLVNSQKVSRLIDDDSDEDDLVVKF